MEVIFKCTNPACGQELSVDESAVGSQIECPSCGQVLEVPAPEAAAPPIAHAAPPAHTHAKESVIAASASAKEEHHFQVPLHDEPSEILIAKPLRPLEVSAKDSEKRVRIRCIRRIDCMEVGKDHFDEFVTEFLSKVGETNIISVNTINYTHIDIGSRAILTDYGTMIVYKG